MFSELRTNFAIKNKDGAVTVEIPDEFLNDEKAAHDSFKEGKRAGKLCVLVNGFSKLVNK